MSFSKIGSADPKYLAATDILIGDMSNTNYEFLLYDRPVILLANDWLRENYPNIGIKTDLRGLSAAIERSLKNPDEFKSQRKYWLEKTIYKSDGQVSKRYIDIILSRSKVENPNFVFIHGDNSVRRTNLEPLIKEVKRREMKFEYVAYVDKNSEKEDAIYIGAHYRDLMHIFKGYKVHIDHDLKGKSALNVEKSIRDYKEYNYVPLIDLYITAGEIGSEFTKLVLGPNADRAVIGGYPKADELIRFNTERNRNAVFKELGFDTLKPLITYAPAAEESYKKPGGSLSPTVLKELQKLASENSYNILVKLKYPQDSLLNRGIKLIKRIILTKRR